MARASLRVNISFSIFISISHFFLFLLVYLVCTGHYYNRVTHKQGEEAGHSVIYLQFYTYASQDLLGLYKVSPTRKSLRPLQNFPL